MKHRAHGILVIIALSLAFSVITANFLVTILGWRYSFGLQAPLGDFESLLAFMVIGALIFPHIFMIPYIALIKKSEGDVAAEQKPDGV